MNNVSSFLPAKVLIALVFCLAGILPAQVHIREKVAITPKASVQTSSTNASSVQLTTELSLSGSTQPTRPPFISVRNITCGTENASNGAPVTVTALAGGYNITAGFGAQGIVDWRLTVRFGSETLTDDSGQAQPNTTLRLIHGYSLFNAVLFSNLWPGSTLRPGSGVEFMLFGENAPACGNALLTENTPFTLTITEGAAYGSLWKNGVSSGSSLTLLLSELPFLQFIADGDVPEEAEANVVIEAIAGGASLGTLKLVVAREIDHFEIVSEHDTLQYGGSTKLTVIAKDENNQEFPYGGSKEVRFSLFPGGGIIVAAVAMAGSPEAGVAVPSVVAEVQAPELGSFIVSQTDTVADEVRVAYSKARAGEVSFLANAATPGEIEPKVISINVEAVENPEKTGSTDVVVDKGEYVKITLEISESTLRPLGNDDNKDNPNHKKEGPDKRRKIIDFSKVEKTRAKIKATNADNQPVEGYSFRIKALVRDNSGGHDHSDGRPTGKFVTALKETLAIVQGKTDSAGKAEYTYVCSGIGGIDSLFVQGATEKDTASAAIMIKIGDWNELPAGTKYKLVGETSAHGRNHFGTANTIKRLKALADSAYADSTWTFQYNDISLMNGGPFDVSPDHRWDTPHQLHREGVNVDMRTVSLDGKNISLRWLEEILKKHNWGRIEEEDKGNANHHFHLTIY